MKLLKAFVCAMNAYSISHLWVKPRSGVAGPYVAFNTRSPTGYDLFPPLQPYRSQLSAGLVEQGGKKHDICK